MKLVSWNAYVARRKINIDQFLALHNINSADKLLTHLKEIGVAPPSEEILNIMFPPTICTFISFDSSPEVATKSSGQKESSRGNASQTRKNQ